MQTHSATFEAFMSQCLSILRRFTPGCSPDMSDLAEQAWANVVEHDTSSSTYINAACRILCEAYLGSGFIMCNGGECATNADKSEVLDLCSEGWPELSDVGEYEYDITPDGEESSDLILEGDTCVHTSGQCEDCYTGG